MNTNKGYTDVIQITYRDMTIMWDLENNQEARTFAMPKMMSESDQFVPLGIRANYIDFDEKQNQSSIFVNCNRDHTLFEVGATEDWPAAALFKTYSALDLFELRFGELRQKGKSVPKIDPECMLAIVYG